MSRSMLPPEEENPSMYVLSNADKLNGAAALLDAKTMEDISEKLGGDFIVLLSSIHETIVLPGNEDIDRSTLEAMVQDVNADQVAPEERLSDHVYMYGSQEKELVLADKMEERQQQRAEARKEAKEAEQTDKPGKTERGDKKPERERVSMKEKLLEKKAEVAKTEQTGNIRYQARRRRRLWGNAQRPSAKAIGRLRLSSGCSYCKIVAIQPQK